jgi:hypothetical protein
MGLARCFDAAKTIEHAGENGDLVTAAAASDRLPGLIDEGIAALRGRYADLASAAQ